MNKIDPLNSSVSKIKLKFQLFYVLVQLIVRSDLKINLNVPFNVSNFLEILYKLIIDQTRMNEIDP